MNQDRIGGQLNEYSIDLFRWYVNQYDGEKNAGSCSIKRIGR